MDAGTLAKLKVLLNLDDRGFRSGLSGAEKQARGFGSVLKSIFTMAGGFVVAQAVIAITRAFAQGIGSAISFGKEMANVNSIAQLSEAALSALSDQVIELAKDSRISDAPATLAAGLYNIISSGFQAADAMIVLQAAAIAATAGLTTTSTSAAAITAVLNAYQLTASDATAVSNSLFQTVNLGVLSFEDLASSIGRVLPTANATGVSLDELGAAYATLTRQGLDAEESTTRINAVLTGLLKPTDALSQALALYGYNSGEALLKSEGLGGALDVLNKIMGGSAEKANEMFGDIRQAQGAIGLTVSDVALYNDMLGQMGNAQQGAGATAKALAEQMKSASFQFGQVKKQAIILVTTFFRLLEPSLAGIARGFAKLLLTVTNFVSFFAEVIRGTKMVTQSFGAMGTSFTHETTNITEALDKIPTSLQNFALGVGDVISMVKLFVTSMIDAWGSTIRVNDLVARFPEPLQKVAKFMLLAADAVGYFVRTLRKDGLMAALGLLPDLLHQVWSGLRGITNQVIDLVISAAVSLGGKFFDWLKQHGGDIWGATKAFFGWTFNVGRELVNLTIDAVIALAGQLQELRDHAGDWIKTAINWTGDKTVEVGRLIINAAVEVRDTNEQATGKSLTDRFVDLVKGIPGAMAAALRAAFSAGTQFADLATFVIGKIVSQFTSVDRITALAKGIGAAFVAAITAAMVALEVITLPVRLAQSFIAGFVIEMTSNGVIAVKDVVASVFSSSNLLTAAGVLTTVLIQKGKDLVAGFKTGAVAGWNLFSLWLSTRPDAVKLSVGSVGETLYSRGKDLLQGMITGAKDKFVDFVSWLSRLKASDGPIAVWVGNLSGTLYSAGSDAIQGLIDGALSKIPGLQSAVNAAKAIFNQIPLLGHSPWPMMIDAGKDAMDGLIIGTTSRMHQLDSAIQSVIGTFAGAQPTFAGVPAVSANSTYTGSGYGAGSTTNWGGVTVVLPNVTNAEEFASELPSALARKLANTVGA